MRARTIGVAAAAIVAANGVVLGLGAARTEPTVVRALGEVIEQREPEPLEVVTTTTELPPIVLPVPEPPPPDARAPTPDIQIGTIEIPRLGVNTALHEGVTLTAIDRGPSHWPGSAMPGQIGNVVIAGHRTTHSKPFWALNEMQPGDEMVLTTADGRFVYTLTEVIYVPSTQIDIINQYPGYEATIFACHPRGSARQRVVGRFQLQDAPPVRGVTVAPGSPGITITAGNALPAD